MLVRHVGGRRAGQLTSGSLAGDRWTGLLPDDQSDQLGQNSGLGGLTCMYLASFVVADGSLIDGDMFTWPEV